jgi:lysophospholipase L1-like esterase
MAIHRRSDTSGFALPTRNRLSMVLGAVVLVAGCGGSAAQSAALVSPTSIAQSPATAVASAPADVSSAVPTVVPSAEPDLMLVAVGDSIPFNSSADCPGCTGFVDRYADVLAAVTGKTVGVRNLSQHNGLQVQGLLDELGVGTPVGRAATLADADAIIVGIAHNDTPWNVANDVCDGPNGDDIDWSKYSADCIATEVKRYTPSYEAVFKRIAELRAGKPTVLRAINRYNDWNGWPGHPLEADGVAATAAVIAAWNKMICGAAEAHGFTCADISTAFNGKDGTLPSGELLARDYTHPSDSGNEMIAAVLAASGFEALAP